MKDFLCTRCPKKCPHVSTFFNMETFKGYLVDDLHYLFPVALFPWEQYYNFCGIGPIFPCSIGKKVILIFHGPNAYVWKPLQILYSMQKESSKLVW